MLKFELLEVLTVKQYWKFLSEQAGKTHMLIDLPDKRQLVWYENYEVHEFLVREEATDESENCKTGPVC